MIFEIHASYKKYIEEIETKVLGLKDGYKKLLETNLDEKYIKVEVKPYQLLQFAKDIDFNMTLVTEMSTNSLWFFWVE
jgi:hypothetical protein